MVRTSRPSLDGLYGHMFRMLSERLADLGLVGFNREKGQLFRVSPSECSVYPLLHGRRLPVDFIPASTPGFDEYWRGFVA